MASKPQSRKAKGRRLQNWVRDLLYSLAPKLEDGDVESRSMGAGGEDVLLSPAARKIFPVSIECKNLARFAGYAPYKQAKDNAKTGHEPIVVIKANREEPLVIVDAVKFFQLLKESK